MDGSNHREGERERERGGMDRGRGAEMSRKKQKGVKKALLGEV